MRTSSVCRGFTLVEVLVTLVVLSIIVSFGLPKFTSVVDMMRARGALNQVAVELYRARMLAVESGDPVRLVLRSHGGACVTTLAIQRADQDVATPLGPAFDLHPLCLRNTGDSILTFNGRGMLRPPARSLYVRRGAVADSVLISIAGRVRRNYR